MQGIDPAATAWLLASTALVLLMTPGLAIFYGGMVRTTGVLNMIMMSFISIPLVTVAWLVLGYTLAFSDGDGFLGNLEHIGMLGISPSTTHGTVPELLFATFQLTFAIITAALISGAIADRAKFSAWMVFVPIWAIVVYSVIAHWVWGPDGWLAKLGALDYAGGLVVEIASGASALALAIVSEALRWLGDIDALIDSGIDAVKILPLAKRLNLSRTSFYWFFEDREALLSALLEGWDQRTTTPLIQSTTAYAETRAEAMLNVLTCFLSADSFDSRLEFAVRSWSLQDENVAARMKAADEARLTALKTMLMKWGIGEVEADIRARTIYLVQIGYISMQTTEDIETRLMRIPMYVKIYADQEPQPREMARFTARFRPAPL